MLRDVQSVISNHIVLLLLLFTHNRVHGFCPYTRFFGGGPTAQKHPNDTPRRPHKHNGNNGNYVVGAQITNNYMGTIMERAEVLKEGQEHLSEADFHGPHGIFITCLTGAGFDLIGDKYGWFTRSSFLRSISFYHAGNALKIGDMFNDFMDREGKVAVEVRGAEAVEHLFTVDGDYSDSLAQMMRSRRTERISGTLFSQRQNKLQSSSPAVSCTERA